MSRWPRPSLRLPSVSISGVWMFTRKESTLLFEMSHQLRELHMRRAAAQKNGDEKQVEEVQAEIDALTNDCNGVLDADDAI